MQINRETFEAWLFSQPDDRVIEASNGTKSFFCSFVRETTKYKGFMFGWEAAHLNSFLGPTVVLPSWLKLLLSRENLYRVKGCSGLREEKLFLTCGELKQSYITLFGNPLTNQINEHISKNQSTSPLQTSYANDAGRSSVSTQR
jgi:hypothetical protein